jgi:hypothetical protein
MKLNILVSWIEMICAPQLSLKPQLLDARPFWATSRAHKPTTVPTGDGYLTKTIKKGYHDEVDRDQERL